VLGPTLFYISKDFSNKENGCDELLFRILRDSYLRSFVYLTTLYQLQRS